MSTPIKRAKSRSWAFDENWVYILGSRYSFHCVYSPSTKKFVWTKYDKFDERKLSLQQKSSATYQPIDVDDEPIHVAGLVALQQTKRKDTEAQCPLLDHMLALERKQLRTVTTQDESAKVEVTGTDSTIGSDVNHREISPCIDATWVRRQPNR